MLPGDQKQRMNHLLLGIQQYTDEHYLNFARGGGFHMQGT